MSELPQEKRELLELAMAKAEKLLAELIAKQEELDRNPPDIPEANRVAGRMAMQNAIASARRMVTSLRDARKIADDNDLL